METQEKKFGFTPFAEIWNGRLAMLGFAIIVGSELTTGQGMLSRIEGMLSHLGLI
ncbi:MAG: chlorophyll a/b-binding protein [Pleurocapsa sp.]